MARRLIVPLLVLFALPVAAQLSDPTKPPLQLAAPQDAGVTPDASSGLQSVILSKGRRPAALINGEVVELGGMVGDMKLVRVREDSVDLRGPGGKETLRLTPAVEKIVKKASSGKQKVGSNATKGETQK